ncbi:MAG: hypothetical protein M3Y59_08975 [Myxococcota bacterium]|nr:hypothetical protein [Myxococcota bacterium]
MSAEREADPPYWVLISVLSSTQPLTPTLAMVLHQAAYDLYRKDGVSEKVAGDLISGTVRNLRKDLVLGSICGPAFEAEIETERGSGMVRFLLTRQGLELISRGEDPTPTARPRYMN